MWLGHLEDSLGYMTQGVSLEDLPNRLRGLHQDRVQLNRRPAAVAPLHNLLTQWVPNRYVLDCV